MTFNELKLEVMHLGFEAQIESDEQLYVATKRALGMLLSDLPVIKRASVMQRVATPIKRIEKIAHSGGESETVDLPGGAYSFAVCGRGYFKIEDGRVSRVEEFDTPLSLYRGRLQSGGTLTLWGEFAHTAMGILCFSDIFSKDEDIPFDMYDREYVISKRVADFSGFHSPPHDKRGEEIPYASAGGDILTLPLDFDGVAYFEYRCSPPEIYPDEGDTEIDLPSEHCELLPTLAASFMWLDDDSEKAGYYMTLYKDQLASVKRSRRITSPTKYRIKDGWA